MSGPTTALSPEWDRWFDETFTDLISTDEELMRAEFDRVDCRLVAAVGTARAIRTPTVTRDP